MLTGFVGTSLPEPHTALLGPHGVPNGVVEVCVGQRQIKQKSLWVGLCAGDLPGVCDVACASVWTVALSLLKADTLQLYLRRGLSCLLTTLKLGFAFWVPLS